MSEQGQKILDGLRDAVAGNYAAVTIEGQRWVRIPEKEALKPAMVSAVELEIEACIANGHVTTRRIGELIQAAVDEITKGYGDCAADQAAELTSLRASQAALVEALTRISKIKPDGLSHSLDALVIERAAKLAHTALAQSQERTSV